jgi:ABC-type dipeptide/oligopeptide/nickel transport system permease component
VIRRLVPYLLTLWVVLTLNFLLPRLLPGDPLDALFDRDAASYVADEAVRGRLTAYYGLDRPLGQQYLAYLAGAAQGNLGWSIWLNRPVCELIAGRLPWTLLLTLTSLTLAFGTFFYLPITAGDVLRFPWRSLSLRSWGALLFSAVFAIGLCYVIWYSSVRRVGNTKTGIYGNITPMFTVLFAHLFLSERITVYQVIGVLIIFFGFYMTRSGYRWFERKKT